MGICPAEENRYGYTAKPPATPPPANNPSLNPAAPAPAPAPAKVGFLQRFRKDLKYSGGEVRKALGRTRDELSYSFHNSTTKFPRHNNLNRHQKRFSGHVRTRNEARTIPYQRPPSLVQRQSSPPSLPVQNRTPRPIQQSTPPPRSPVEIVRPNEQPVTKKQPVNKPPAKQKDTTTLPVEKNVKPPTPLTPPPKESVADKKSEPKNKPDYPVALKTENTGFVKSPYPPFTLLDVRDVKPGGLAMEPDSDRIFRVPE